jgi:hypothetical protein
VRNTGTTLSTSWTVTWSFPSDKQKITSWTNATGSQKGSNVTARNGLLNGLLLPGAATTFTIKGSGKAASPIPTLTCVPS